MLGTGGITTGTGGGGSAPLGTSRMPGPGCATGEGDGGAADGIGAGVLWAGAATGMARKHALSASASTGRTLTYLPTLIAVSTDMPTRSGYPCGGLSTTTRTGSRCVTFTKFPVAF